MKILYKTKKYALMLTVALSAVITQSCTEDIDTSDRYTFTGKTIVSYLQDFPETYSEYSALLDSVNVSDFSQSKMSQLLSARGNYTCFAPTNEAIQKYLEHLKDSGIINKASWDADEFQQIDPETQTRALLESVRRTIVHNSIIDCGDNEEAYFTADISERAEQGQMLAKPNMNDRKLQCTRLQDGTYAINGCNISATNCDIYTINGRIHQVGKVIAPNEQNAADFFKKKVSDREYGFYTFAALVDACGLSDMLAMEEDDEYYRKIMTNALKELPIHPTEGLPGILPERRYYGYTIFAEPDSWWETELKIKEGSITELAPEELVAKVAEYVSSNGLALSSAQDNADYTDPNNTLNQFVTYHIIPGRIESSKLVIHFNEFGYHPEVKRKASSVAEFYTTAGKRRLIKTYEASTTYDGKSNIIYLNRFPKLKNLRGADQDYTETGCDAGKEGVEIMLSGNPDIYNAYLYRISDCLYFNDRIAEIMASERIRMDFSSMFPELLTNDIRANESKDANIRNRGIPVTSQYQYLENCEISDKSNFFYLTGRHAYWQNYQNDEFNVVGNYEVTIKLPPVPKDGIYELRIGIQANAARGMCQVYWGNDKENLPATDIPVDMRMAGQRWYITGGQMESILGWEDDVEGDDELNAENDKKLRQNMAMKAPNSYWVPGGNTTMRNLDNGKVIRRILVREDMKADETYYLRLKSVLDDDKTQLYLDFMEYCSKEVYDNPQTPEDIW